MKVITKKFLFLVLALVLSAAPIGTAANNKKVEVDGTLTKATKSYIVVNNNKYTVTDKTIVSDMEHPEKGFPYSPELFSHPFNVVVIIEDGTVKKILVGVPK